MGINHSVRGRGQAVPMTPQRRASFPPPAALLLLLTAVLLIAAVGCGKQRVERKSASTHAGRDSTATTSAVKHAAKGNATSATRSDEGRNASTNRVRLTYKSCVQCEPQWASISVGQSMIWSSDLKQRVTIHVSSGAFDKTEYVVGAGATVSSGPARRSGSFSIWTEPAACQGIPRGAQGSGPGVTVLGATQH